MKVIVVGCGRIGAELAYRLFKRGHHVAVIDHIASAFNNLPADFFGRTIEGEALNQTVLRRADIEQVDGLAAVTNSDSLNAVVAHVARSVYNISNVVARNFDPQWRSLFEAFDLQVVSSTVWGAQRIEEQLSHVEMRAVFSAGNGEVEIYEFAVPKPWGGRQLGDLLSTTDSRPVSLTRAGRAVIPDPELTLAENDILLVSATFDGIEAIRQRLYQNQEH